MREITNPRIFAAVTGEELYNDPAVIIIKDRPDSPLPLACAAAILNSKLATFLHFNSSPKASKGAFPKILVHDVETFPMPKAFPEDRLQELSTVAAALEACAATDQASADLERKLDFLVYALYGLTKAEIDLVERGFTAFGAATTAPEYVEDALHAVD